MKLHLGSGIRYIPGYVHIDAVPYKHIDHVTSINRLPFIKNDSVDVIYNCHVLEHFKREEVAEVLSEWRRVLKPGGILRTSVPDFESLVNIYLKYGDLKKIIGPLFGRQDYLYNVHYNVFDMSSLTELLVSVGFTSVAKYNWADTDHANIDDYSQAYIPHMDKSNGILLSLNVECVK